MKFTPFTVLRARLRRAAARIVFFLREYFFPAGCALCGVTLLDMNETWYGLCETCRAELSDDIAWMDGTDTAAMENRCAVCGKPMVSGKGRCLSCRAGPPRPYERMISVFGYSGKYRKLFGAYKFGKNIAIGHFFAEIIIKAYRLLQAANSENQPLIDEWSEIAPCVHGHDRASEETKGSIPRSSAAESRRRLSIVAQATTLQGGLFKAKPCGMIPFIVPVPPRPGKIKKDGWDQVEYLTRLAETERARPEAAGTGGVPVCRCLKRLSSKVQKKLNRKDRLHNLAGRIVLTKPPPPVAVIIDDVITTGATMDVCASALKAGGCRKVYGICLVYD